MAEASSRSRQKGLIHSYRYKSRQSLAENQKLD